MNARTLVVALLPALLAAPARAQFEWSAYTSYPDRLYGTSVAAGDVDGDGTADVVLASALPGTIQILLGDGAGGVRVGALATFGSTIYDVVLADLDRDGRDEILFADATLPAIRVVATDERGEIALVTDYPTPILNSFTVADEDGDGFTDVIAACGQLGVVCWHGDGAGGLVRYSTIVTGVFALSVTAGDWNADGLADLAVGINRIVDVRLADGTGGYPSAGVLDGSFYSYTHVAAGDLDGNGLVDLAVASVDVGGSTVALFGGWGTGAFSRFAEWRDRDRRWTEVAVVDLDGERDWDVIVSAESSPRTLLSNGEREFVDSVSRPPIGRTLAVADFDSDGFPDVATERAYRLNRCHEARRGTVNSGAGPTVDVLLVNGLPGFGRERRLSLGAREPFVLIMEAPPSRPAGPSRYALYAWLGAEPTSRTLPLADEFGIGRAILPMPVTSGLPQPSVVWNNLRGTEARLGFPDRPSRPAPVFVAARPAGLGRPATFFLQGIVRDDGAPNGKAAMTNAIQVIVR